MSYMSRMDITFQLHHIAISVKDAQISEDFYALFGFERVHRWEAEDKSLQIIHLKNNEGIILELFCYASPEDLPTSATSTKTDLPIIGVKHFGLRVESVEKAKEAIQKQGISIVTDITKGRTGPLYFFIKDPDGILVEIMQDDRKFEL